MSVVSGKLYTTQLHPDVAAHSQYADFVRFGKLTTQTECLDCRKQSGCLCDANFLKDVIPYIFIAFVPTSIDIPAGTLR